MSRRLDEVRLAVLMVDGIELKGRTNVVVFGITTHGRKTPLGLWDGSTENARRRHGAAQRLRPGAPVEMPRGRSSSSAPAPLPVSGVDAFLAIAGVSPVLCWRRFG